MVDAARHPAALERHSTSADAGKVERFHGSLQRAWERRGMPQQKTQAWLEAYR
jgi:hypothetical protein